MKTVEIFKTNVTELSSANDVIKILSDVLPESKINFDLNDCDNILRIESLEVLNTDNIKKYLSAIGFHAELLD